MYQRQDTFDAVKCKCCDRLEKKKNFVYIQSIFERHVLNHNHDTFGRGNKEEEKTKQNNKKAL